MNQVRALAQLVCILMMLAFAMSFAVNNAEEEELNERDRFAVMAKYYATKSSDSFTERTTSESSSATARGRRNSRSRSTSPSKRSTKSSPGRSSGTVFV